MAQMPKYCKTCFRSARSGFSVQYEDCVYALLFLLDFQAVPKTNRRSRCTSMGQCRSHLLHSNFIASSVHVVLMHDTITSSIRRCQHDPYCNVIRPRWSQESRIVRVLAYSGQN